MGFLGLGTKVQLYTLSGQIFFDSLAYSLIGSCRENMRSQIGEDGMDATLQQQFNDFDTDHGSAHYQRGMDGALIQRFL